MSKEYRIYPGIGIGRLGDSSDSFFLAPEVPGQGPLELTSDDSIQKVQRYKDAQHKIRKQGVRFRVFEVELNNQGETVAAKEITSADAEIVWQVQLANEKAAAGRFVSETNPEADVHRNPGVAEADLIIKALFPSLSGKNAAARATTPGKFKGKEVFLGELITDHKGRLIVLGGNGNSSSVPDGLPLGDNTSANPNHPQNSFANNEGWHDDISDGPVSATVTFPGQTPIEINDAWVIFAPPDYSPYTRGVTTLYDVAYQAAILNGWLKEPQLPSFNNDILPVIQAAANLRWVSSLRIWDMVPRDWAALARTDASSSKLRQDTYELLMGLEGGALQNFKFMPFQSSALEKWSKGEFINDYNASPPAIVLSADGIERASLEQGVGGGFYPGIEAGIRMTYKEFYSSPFRLKRTPFISHSVQISPRAGYITRNMACPWQADFIKCASQSSTSIWWPAQRPIEVFAKGMNGLERREWSDGIGTHKDLVGNFSRLGFILPTTVAGGDVELVEAERNDDFPHN